MRMAHDLGSLLQSAEAHPIRCLSLSKITILSCNEMSDKGK